MKVSLKEFLETGRLGHSWIGIDKDTMVKLIGDPDEFGKIFRKDKKPNHFKYADIEFAFDRFGDECIRFRVKSANGLDFVFPGNAEVKDWGIAPDSNVTDVEDYLKKENFKYNKVKDGSILWIQTDNGIRMYFDEDSKLISLGYGLM